MTRSTCSRMLALGALMPLLLGVSWGLSGGIQKKEIFFSCIVALIHGLSTALFRYIAIGNDTVRFMIWGVLAPVLRSGATVLILVAVYSRAGFACPDVFLACGLAGVLCLEAGEMMALHFKTTDITT